MKAAERHRLISRIVDEFEARGWREDGHTALAIARLVDQMGPGTAEDKLDRVVERRFLVQNATTVEAVQAAVTRALK
jgi:hypothetical protein